MENSKNFGGTASSIHSKDTSQPDDAAYKHDVENQSSHDNNNFDTATHEKTPKDPNIVDWDGPSDPANPTNWSSAKKFGAIGVVSLITMLS
jgi:hypothetical protein